MDLGEDFKGFWMDLGMFLAGFSMNFEKVFDLFSAGFLIEICGES